MNVSVFSLLIRSKLYLDVTEKCRYLILVRAFCNYIKYSILIHIHINIDPVIPKTNVLCLL